MALIQKAYLGSTPLFRDTPFYQDDSLTFVQTAGINVVTGGVAHTKGSWFTLISSTSANASLLFFRCDGLAVSGTNTAALIDIGTGANGAETVIVSNVAIGGASASTSIVVPFRLPSGTRLAARVQSAVAGRTFRCDPFLYNDGKYSIAPTSVDVTTADTVNSKGIEFSGASGSWTTGFASTPRDYRGVSIVPSMHSNDITNITGSLDVGVGTFGNEVIFGSSRLDWINSEAVRNQYPGQVLFGRGSKILAGSRISVRHPITANPERYGFTLIGIP
jgi:hypothetical protein